MKTYSVEEKRGLNALILVFVGLAVGIITGGYLNYQNYEKQYRAEVERQLSAIAELKVGELVQWRKERLGDAAVFYQNAAFSDLTRRYFGDRRDTEAQSQLKTWLGQVQQHYQYERISLLDAQSVEQIAVPGEPQPVASILAQHVSELFLTRQVTLVDFYRNEFDQRVYLALLVPVLDTNDSSRAIGALAMRIDPEGYLYPFLSRWPTPSQTAETLLVRRDGNDTLFLNELKFQKNTALKLRIPLSSKDVPAVKAALGQVGIVEGIDYRGVSVLADVRAVPDSPWFLVARMDMAEVYTPLRARLWQTIAFFGALLFSAGAGVAMIWRQQRIRTVEEISLLNAELEFRVEERTAELSEATSNLEQKLNELEQMQDTLHESETKYRIIAGNTLDWEYWVDPEGQFIYVSPSCKVLTGYTSEDFMEDASLYEHIIHPEDQDMFRNHLIEALEERQFYELEFRIVRPDGITRWVEHVCQPVYDDDGTFLGTRGCNRDITGRMAAEESLREINQFTWEIVADAGEGIVVYDLEGRHLVWNPFMEELTGLPAMEVQGQHGRDVFPDLWEQVISQSLQRNLVGEAVISADVPLIIPQTGKSGWIRMAFTPHRNAKGKIGGAIAVVQDVTQRKQAEEDIRRHAASAEALARVASRLNEQLDLSVVLKTVCEETARALHAPAAWVNLYDLESDTLAYAETFGLPSEFRERYYSPSRSLFETYIRRVGDPIIIPDVQALTDIPNTELYTSLNVRTVANGTMWRDGKLIGVLSVVNFNDVRQFNVDEVSLLKGLADLAAQAITNSRLFEDVQRHFKFEQALHQIDLSITSTIGLQASLDAILEQVTIHLGVDAAQILLLNPETLTLQYVAGRGFYSNESHSLDLNLGEGIAGQVAYTRERVCIPNLMEASQEIGQIPLLAEGKFVSYFGTPLIAKDQLQGVLEIYHRSPLNPDAEWLGFLDALSTQTAIAIDNIRLFDRLQDSYIELALAYDTTLVGWSHAMDLRDKETEGHTQRVTEKSVRLAREIGFTEDELVHVRRGALLHDIGKMGIPDSILLKPGPLSDIEWIQMRKHPQYAYDMLWPVVYLRPALDIPYYHHEKWDGTGYSNGLKGEQIPLSARLFAVVDVWDALRSDRPYRPALPEVEVLEYITQQAGKHFDPHVVECFLRMGELIGNKVG